MLLFCLKNTAKGEAKTKNRNNEMEWCIFPTYQWPEDPAQEGRVIAATLKDSVVFAKCFKSKHK